MPRGVTEYDTGMIQGRNAAAGNTLSVISPGFITDGLALHLDAGNAASYSGSGTTWYDISGTAKRGTLANGALLNGPTFDADGGGSFILDGIDDRAQVTGALTVTEATFLAWIKRNGDGDDGDGIIFSRLTASTGMFLKVSAAGVNRVAYNWNNDANTYGWAGNSGLLTPNAAWCMMAVSVNASAATAYLGQSSGLTSATNTNAHASTTMDDVHVGYDTFGTVRHFKGRVAIACIYFRALSPQEITRNFDATRARFGV